MNSYPKPTMLMILDGFGMNPDTHGNAIASANTPNLDAIFEAYPKTTLKACGMDVGLPEGQMGNSEVGHLNIGSGRIVYQELTRITKAIDDESFYGNEALNAAMDHVLERGSSLHLLGLLSDGGVHSHISHLLALITMAAFKGVKKVYVHALLDGRDVPPTCAEQYIIDAEKHMETMGVGRIATLGGRYYGMDRDKRWDRVEKYYDAMTIGEGRYNDHVRTGLFVGYENEETDEFVSPTVILDQEGNPGLVSDGDAIIMFNFRPDRAREITRAFVDPNFDGFKRKKTVKDLCYVCMTQYDAEMPNVQVAFKPEKLENTLGQYISSLGLKQLRIAETEKYAHVTFFFNGGVEEPNPGEDRILIPSPKVATYDLQPEMSAYLVAERVLDEINADKYDVIILNFANADMVGHTGVYKAAEEAVEALDRCIPEIISAVLSKGGQILLTADHGNADVMLDAEDNVVTAHSLSDVPLVHISSSPRQLKDGGRLADIAPTLLALMGIDAPGEMTGTSLLK